MSSIHIPENWSQDGENRRSKSRLGSNGWTFATFQMLLLTFLIFSRLFWPLACILIFNSLRDGLEQSLSKVLWRSSRTFTRLSPAVYYDFVSLMSLTENRQNCTFLFTYSANKFTSNVHNELANIWILCVSIHDHHLENTIRVLYIIWWAAANYA